MIIAPSISSAALHRVAMPAPPAPSTDPVPPPAFDHVFDFPTLAPGDTFRIARGSTFNGIGIGGEAKLPEISPTSAEVWIRAGAFGMSKEATLAVLQTSPTTASVTVTEKGGQPVTITADIVAVRPNYSEFVSADPALAGGATLQLDSAGRFVVDVQGAAFEAVFGAAARLHLVLEKTTPPA